MKTKIQFLPIMLLVLLFASCASNRGMKKDAFPVFYGEKPPVSVLIMPPINQSDNVDAKDFFFYSLNQAIGDMGYYVYPSLLSMNTLQEESAYDSELFAEGDITPFKRLYGADVCLFTTITKWKKSVVGQKITIGIEYAMRSTETGETIWNRKGEFTYKPSSSGGGGSLIALAVQVTANMLSTALTDTFDVAKTCNFYVIPSGLPAGKYSPDFQKDGETAAGAESVKVQSTYLIH